MRWTRWLILILVIVCAGWMIFDGSRALIVGDYVTPAAGRYAGQLGPWSKIVAAVGIPPRSTAMKLIFVVYGLAYLATTAAFVSNASWAKPALIIVAMLGLWHLPLGTLINLAVIALVLAPALAGKT